MAKTKAVLTTEVLLKTTIKDFTAIPTKGCFDAGEFLRTTLAK